MSMLLLMGIMLPHLSYARIAHYQPSFSVDDISYGKDFSQKLSIYYPNYFSKNFINKPKPVILYVHGGAWRYGDKDSAKNHGEYYVEKNVIFVAINYRLSNTANHPAQVEDVALAIKWIYNNISDYQGDPNNVSLIGHSAGAHLVSLVATNTQYLNKQGINPDIIKLVVPVDTIAYDLPYAAASNPKAISKLIYKNFGQNKKLLELASPIFHANKTSVPPPPFLIFSSDKRPGAVKEARLFNYALKKAGSKPKHITLNHISHKNMNSMISGPGSPIATEILRRITE